MAGWDASGHPQGHLSPLQHQGMRWSLRSFPIQTLLACRVEAGAWATFLDTLASQEDTDLCLLVWERTLFVESHGWKGWKRLIEQILGSEKDALDSSPICPSAQLRR